MAQSSKPWIAAALVAFGVALPYAIPVMKSYQMVSGGRLQRVFAGPFTGKPGVPMTEPAVYVAPMPVVQAPAVTQSVQPSTPAAPVVTAPVASAMKPSTEPAEALPQGPVLEDPANALKSFHEALARSEAGQGTVRICHFGDSPVTGDLISGEARARFQQLYGNGGHGWILPGRPWEWYGHLGVNLDDSGWRINTPITNGRHDHAYGFAGAAFTSCGGANTKISTTKKNTFNHLEIHYLGQPKGGTLQIKVDGEVSTLITQKPEIGPAVDVIPLPEDTPHQITLHPKGDGEVVLYGVVMESGNHGVVYDALGSNGATVHHLTLMNEANWEASLKLRHPDLIILAFGTNESGYANIPGTGYNQDYREIIRRIRAALPGVSILIMAPMDRAERNGEGEVVTMPSIPKIVEAQRKLAQEMGCAFFNSYAAVGGEGTALRWYKASPRLMSGDYTHPTREGADRLAQVLVEALRPAPIAHVAATAVAPVSAPAAPESKATETKP
jgi:lysophospholipase L1-like esterase